MRSSRIHKRFAYTKAAALARAAPKRECRPNRGTPALSATRPARAKCNAGAYLFICRGYCRHSSRLHASHGRPCGGFSIPRKARRLYSRTALYKTPPQKIRPTAQFPRESYQPPLCRNAASVKLPVRPVCGMLSRRRPRRADPATPAVRRFVRRFRRIWLCREYDSRSPQRVFRRSLPPPDPRPKRSLCRPHRLW